tara:strand:- start:1364 stop:2920 length:1557 start_codon:yes stop_codon:yes gene_type:complete
MNILKSFSLISGLTFLSRVFGYIRDFIFAFVFGSSSGADSFLLAFRLPNLFRRLFAEGAISNAIIPIYLDIKKKSNKKFAELFSNSVFSYLILLLLFFSILAEVFMLEIVTFLAPGFSTELLKKTTFLASIMFPYLILISASSFIGALLNANGRFALWAFSPIILNLGMITALAVSYIYSTLPELTLAWFVIISGIFQLLIMIIWSAKKNIKIRLIIPSYSLEVKKLFSLLLPNILAGGILQVNQFIGLMFASSIVGAISWLYYADRIVQLPLGVFVISISTVLLTVLSKEQLKKNKKSINKSIESACLLMLCLTLISMVGLLVLSDLIVDILFKRGKFGLGDVFATSDAIVMYSIGLPAFGFVKIFSVIFFSKKNTLIPFVISTFSMLINLLLIFLFITKLGHLGIALALSLSSYFNAIILYLFLLIRKDWVISKKLFFKIFKIFLAAFLTYIVLITSYMLILWNDYINLEGAMSKIFTLLTLMAIAVFSFIIILTSLNVINFKMLRDKNLKELFKE